MAAGIWQELKLQEKGCLERAVNLGEGTQPLPDCDLAEREREEELMEQKPRPLSLPISDFLEGPPSD